MTKGFRLMVTVAAFSALALGGCATLGSDGPGQSAKYGGASESGMTGPSGAPGETYPGGPPSGGG
jgi:hypothetical protein